MQLSGKTENGKYMLHISTQYAKKKKTKQKNQNKKK